MAPPMPRGDVCGGGLSDVNSDLASIDRVRGAGEGEGSGWAGRLDRSRRGQSD